MAQVIEVQAYRIYGFSGVTKIEAGDTPLTIGVPVKNQSWDVRPLADPTNADVYSLLTVAGEPSGMPVQYWLQDTVAQVIAAANA